MPVGQRLHLVIELKFTFLEDRLRKFVNASPIDLAQEPTNSSI